MKIVRVSEVEKENPADDFFTGDAPRQVLLPGADVRVTFVGFEKGVVNKWHSHSGEQVLIVTGGRGYVATDKEKRVVIPGDVVMFETGEKHWHGATEDSDFSHIGITKTGTKTTRLY